MDVLRNLMQIVIFLYFTGADIDYDSYNKSNNKANITFLAGVTCASLDVRIINDSISERDEIFNVSIINKSIPYGVGLGASHTASVNITDNDSK